MATLFSVASALDGLRRLREQVDAPRALREYGLRETGITAPSTPSWRPCPDNPVPVTAANLEELLRRASRAWEGRGPQMSLNQQGGTVSSEQEERESQLVERVVASFDATPDPRLKELMQALTRHLHAFAREVRLTEQEWQRAIEFLTAVGHITDDRRQEFILLSDVLGASMQTITINNVAYQNATEATVVGPFFVAGSPEIELGGDIAAGAPGEPCWVEGRVTDTSGKPVPHALIEVWEADHDGLYDVQYDDGRVTARGHLHSDAGGGYRFWGVTPTPYPIPHDGPVGRLLAAVGRSPMRTAHLHFMVKAEGFRTLVTHIFVRGDELLDRDAVFGVRDSLVMDFEPQRAGTPIPGGRDLGSRAWSRVRFDIVLAPAAAP